MNLGPTTKTRMFLVTLAGAEGLEPPSLALEARILPLNYAPLVQMARFELACVKH